MATNTSANILDIIQGAANSLGMVQDSQAQNYAKIDDLLAARKPVTSIDGQTVESVSQAGAGKLVAQNAGIDFMGIMASPELQTQLADQFTRAQSEAKAANDALVKASSTTFFDDPLMWMYNQTIMPDLQNAANATAQKAATIQNEMVARNTISQEFTRTQQQNARVLSVESVDSQVAAMKSAIDNANIAMEIEQLTHRTKTIADLSRMSQEQVDLAFKADSIRFRNERAAAEDAARAEARKLALAKLKEDEGAEQTLTKAIQRGATMLGYTDIAAASPEEAIKTIKAMGSVEGGKQLLGQLASAGFTGQIADNPVDFAKTSLVVPINTSALSQRQARVVKEIGSVSAQATGGQPVRNQAQAEALTVAVNKYLEDQTKVIRPDSAFKAPTIIEMAGMDVVKGSPFLRTVAKEAADSKQLDYTPDQLLARAAIYAKNNPNYSTAQLIKDVTGYYKAANLVVNADMGGKAMGIDVLKTYKWKTELPIVMDRVRATGSVLDAAFYGLRTQAEGSVKNIDYVNDKEVASALLRYMGKPQEN